LRYLHTMPDAVELSADYHAKVEAQIVAVSGGNDKMNQEGAYQLWMLAVSTVSRCMYM